MSKHPGLESPETYLAWYQKFSGALHTAIGLNDVEAMGIALQGLTDVARHLRLGLQAKYGETSEMGALSGRYPKWKGVTPQRVLDDMRNAIEIDGGLIKDAEAEVPEALEPRKAELRKEVRRLTTYLRALIRKGKKRFERDWPGWWTPEREAEFEDFLSKE
jgi:hypothetical protein